MKTIQKTLILLSLLASLADAQADKFMMVFLTIDPNRPQLPQQVIDSLQTAHMANIQNLANEGKLLIAGPFDGGGGIFVLATDSKDTARAWLSTDPAIRSKRWIIETYPYVPRIGSICRVVVQYEMTTYSFIRFEWKEGKVENQLMKLVDRGSIVAAGGLQGSGSILVVRGDIDEAVMKKDRVVREGKVGATVRKLFIAKGSFCEK
ncbi:MAG TPA: YciI family protein [Bacteroidota bacterium]|nr:YciI family protein [Bacteroidota bacterium]